MNLIPIDEVIEMWVRVHKDLAVQDSDLNWWREAMAHLRPTPEDDATLEDENA